MLNYKIIFAASYTPEDGRTIYLTPPTITAMMRAVTGCHVHDIKIDFHKKELIAYVHVDPSLKDLFLSKVENVQGIVSMSSATRGK